MYTIAALVTVCLGSTLVTASSILAKPYYELEAAENLFKDFVKQYKKSYDRNEYLARLEIFKDSLREINWRNAEHPQTVFAVNHFADLTREERQQYRGLRLSNTTRVKVTIPDSSVRAPDQLDWREQNVVSHVKNQGNCGSCYIFSAIGNIEGQYALKHKQCLAFSEGQSLDCLDCGSCDGGIMDQVMKELSQRAGVMKEEDYPYVDKKHSCKEDANKMAARVLGGSEINIPDEDTLKQKLAEIGPLAVGIAANDLDHYTGGILHPNLCKGRDLDHGMVLVGYGEEDGTKFWIIKNSWGESWGEGGYVRLLRGVDACKMGTSFTASATVA